MALPTPDPEARASKSSQALTFAISAIILGAIAIWLAIHSLGMEVVLLIPVIGVAMLMSAGFCFYWLIDSDETKEPRAIRTFAQILTGLLILFGFAALSFLGMGGFGIYK